MTRRSNQHISAHVSNFQLTERPEHPSNRFNFWPIKEIVHANQRPSSTGAADPLPSTRASTHGSHQPAGWVSRARSRAPRASRGCGRRGSTCPCHRSVRARWCGTRPARSTARPSSDSSCTPRSCTASRRRARRWPRAPGPRTQCSRADPWSRS